MDRLTINLPFTDGNPCYHYVDKEAAYNGSQKLGQYEDIGTPKELAELKTENERLNEQLKNSVENLNGLIFQG